MESHDVFEQMAHRYDTQERVTIAKIIVEQIRTELADTKDKTALDYGCGTGLIGLGLIDMFSSMLFVDASAQMIEQVKHKIKAGRIETADTLCSDFMAEVPSAKADYVIMSQTLLHIKDTKLILARLFDVVNKGGHLIIVDFDKNERINHDKVHNGFEQNELIRLVKQAGFSSAKSKTFYHGRNMFMNQDASLFILNAEK